MIVRRGAPFFSNQAPLLGISFPTVEGPLRLGGSPGKRGMGLLLPATGLGASSRPRIAPSIRRGMRGRGLRGLGDAPSISMQNLTSGNSSNFRVGDQWRVTITGAAPNSGVYLNTSVCSPDFSRCAELPKSGQQDIALSLWTGSYQTGNSAIGKTDGAGNYTASGTFTSAQVGLWTQAWSVTGSSAVGVQFTVSDVSGSAAYAGQVIPGGTAYYTIASNHPAATYTPAELLAMATAPPPASGAAASSRASLTFENLTTGVPAVMKPGDQYRITIRGAAPGKPVTGTASKNGGAATTSPFGSTGADGSFIYAGVIAADSVGNWAETWNVDGIPVGSFSFSVGPGASGSGTGSGGGSGSGGSTGSNSVTDFVSSFSVSSIPTWAWIAGAGVGAMLLFKGK